MSWEQLGSLRGVPGSDAGVQYVEVTSGLETRPEASFVVWMGGSTQPVNMINGDLWFAVSTGVPPASDTTPPTVPSGVLISEQTPTSFKVSWTASTDAVGVTGYEVQVNSAPQLTSSATLVISGLTAATSYSVQVRARDSAGNWSALSSVVTATTAEEPVVVATEHSIFSGPPPTTLTGYNDGGVLLVTNGFYSYGDTTIQRVVGIRIYKTGIFSTSGTAYAFLSNPAAIPNLQAPTLTKAYSGLVNGWNTIRFDTPLTLPVGVPVWLGYQSSDGSYVHGPSHRSDFTNAEDGSKIVLMEISPDFGSVTVNRSYFSSNGEAAAVGGGSPLYGVDIIADEGP